VPRDYRGTRPFPSHVGGERDAKGLSQAAVAEKAGIPRPTLSEIENGERLASPEQLDALADAIGVSAARLYDPEWLEVIGKAAKAQRANAEAGESVA
jgi:transcriptional regulator with XRE-family HTH domain